MNGTYWLTVLPETSQLRPQIKKALAGVDRDAVIRPTIDTKGARRAGEQAGRDIQSGVESVSSRGTKLGSMFRLDGAREAGQRSGNELNKGLNSVDVGSGLNRKISQQVSESNAAELGARYGRTFGESASSSAKVGLGKLTGLLATVGAGAAVVGGFKSAISAGMEFTTNLNTMGAVSGATSDQLAKVSEKARQLGADAQLPGVSAQSAAQAMTELAKGGFDVQQSMDAARGSLQLAGAAGVDATTAATIQSDTLHTFAMNAADAGRAADVLAGAANGSSVEINDIALSMSAGGSVAHGLGMSLEDTASTIGMFANMGIKGSDAGTSLKTSLLALTNSSKPVVGAFEELGVKAFDAQGKFIGMRGLIDQLSAASKRMTQEEYQWAASTAFGTDGVRFAMLAAQQGTKGFDDMTKAVTRSGVAAEVAAARTKGLPGAWANFKNQLDGVKLALYDKLQQPLAVTLNYASSAIEKLMPVVERGADKIGAFFTQHAPAIKAFGASIAAAFSGQGLGRADTAVSRLSEAAKSLGPPLKGMGPALSTIGKSVASIGSDTITSVAVPALHLLADSLGFIADHAATIGPALAGLVVAFAGLKVASTIGGNIRVLGESMRNLFTPITLAATFAQTRAIRAQAVAMTELTAALGTNTSAQEINSAAQTRFGRTVGATKGALSGLKSVGSGLTGMLGGPLGIALTGAAAGLAWLASKHAEAAAKADEHRAAEKELQSQLDASSGVLTKEYLSSVAQRFQDTGMFDSAKSLGVEPSRLIDAATSRDESGLARLKAMSAAAGPQDKGRWDELLKAVMDEGSAFVRSTKAVRERSEALEGSGKATDYAIDYFKKLGAAVVEVPNSKTIVVQGLTEEAIGNLRLANLTVTQIPGRREVTVTADTAEGLAEIAMMVQRVENLHPTIGIGANMQTADNVFHDWVSQVQGKPIVLHPTVAAGSDPFALPGGPPAGPAPGGHALGGWIRGAGTGTSDSILARVSNGEWITNAVDAKKNAPLLAMINAGVPVYATLQRLMPGFAGGGQVGPDVKVAEGMVGTAYSQATRFDCSGSVARVINGALGQSGGLMSTKNAREWLSARGFVDGSGGPGQIRVGWYDHGPNPNDGHMAMTLSDGRNAESGGSHGSFLIGAGAAGANDPQFDNHMFLPTLYGEGPAGSASALGAATSGSASGGSSRAVASAQTAVKNAQQSVDDHTYRRDQAQKRLDEAKAKGKGVDEAQHSLDVANRELADAKDRQTTASDRLTDAEQNAATAGEKANSKSGGGDEFGDLGKSLWGGLLETIGLDGSVFSNPFEWPTVKSAMAAVNVLGKALSGDGGSATSGGGGGGGDASGLIDAFAGGAGLQLPNLNPAAADINATPAGNAAPDTTVQGASNGQGGGGPAVVIENAGMAPKDVQDKLNSTWNQRGRTGWGAH